MILPPTSRLVFPGFTVHKKREVLRLCLKGKQVSSFCYDTHGGMTFFFFKQLSNVKMLTKVEFLSQPSSVLVGKHL